MKPRPWVILRYIIVNMLTCAPYIYRYNVVERAIYTFKNHLIASICKCGTRFTARKWDRIIPQAVLTFNIIRSVNHNPTLSAHHAIIWKFNFSTISVTPYGYKVLVCLKLGQRKTFGSHGIDSYYINSSLNSYRCYHYCIPDTGSVHRTNTVNFSRK